MRVRTIRCRRLVEMVTDYLENALSRSQMAAVRAHLAGCDDCRAYVAQMHMVIALNRNEFDAVDTGPSLPPDKVDPIMDSFRRRATPG